MAVIKEAPEIVSFCRDVRERSEKCAARMKKSRVKAARREGIRRRAQDFLGLAVGYVRIVVIIRNEMDLSLIHISEPTRPY